MKDVVVNEIMKELNWRERIIVSILKNTFIKVYNITRVEIFNRLLK